MCLDTAGSHVTFPDPISNLPGPLTNGLKYFRFLLRFRPVNTIFCNIPAVSFCGESLMTPAISYNLNTGL